MAMHPELARQQQATKAAEMVKDMEAKQIDREHELFTLLERMLRTYGQVQLLANQNGTIDVRCGGTASYATRLRDAVQNRVQIEADRVTNKLMGGDAAEQTQGAASGYSPGISGAVNFANKL